MSESQPATLPMFSSAEMKTDLQGLCQYTSCGRKAPCVRWPVLLLRCIHREFKHISAEFIDMLQSSPREYTWQLVGAALQNPLLEDPDNGW